MPMVLGNIYVLLVLEAAGSPGQRAFLKQVKRDGVDPLALFNTIVDSGALAVSRFQDIFP